MPASHLISQSVPVARLERPRCPTCHCRMPLARIKAGSTGLDLRSFACTTCDHLHNASPAADPMNPGTLGWMFADLNPPS